MDFKHTTTSLNDVYEISYRHALELIIKNGGEVTESAVKIMRQNPKTLPLEQSFPGYTLADNIKIHKKIKSGDSQELVVEFDGIGIVVKGKVKHVDFEKKYVLESSEETLDNYEMIVEFSIDGQLSKTMELPLNFIERAHELFFQYELEEGKHTLRIKVTNPIEKVYLHLWNAIIYTSKN